MSFVPVLLGIVIALCLLGAIAIMAIDTARQATGSGAEASAPAEAHPTDPAEHS